MRVLFVAPRAREEDAAWSWLAGRHDIAARRVVPGEATAADLGDADVVWVHASRPPDLPAGLLAERAAAGGLLLTLRSAGLVAPLGLERAPPGDEGEGHWSHAAGTDRPGARGARRAPPARPALRGMAAFGPHPLFDGLHQGTFCWAPREREGHAWSCYAPGARPGRGRVVALERTGEPQDARRVVAWEYPARNGAVLCLGALVHFAAGDARCRPQLERLTLNALRAAAGAAGGPRAWWPEPGAWARPDDDLPLPDPLDLDGALPEPSRDPLALEADAGADHPFDLAGRRALLLGRERRGILECWVHPHRVIAAWDVAADTEPAPATRVRLTPDVVVRDLETSTRRLRETLFVALEHPVAVIEYRAARRGRESVGRAPASFEVRATLDLRRLWPYAAGSGGDLRFRRSPHGLVAVVETSAGDAVAAVFAGRPVELAMRGVHHEGAPAVEYAVTAPLGIPLRLAVVAAGSREELDRTLRAVHRLGLAGLARQRATRAQTLREARVSLRADDARLVRAVEWAKRRLDALLGEVPRVGRSLFAGAALPRPGLGRPACAWFTGREACWSAMALLAAGEHSVPRQVLRFLGDTQDVDGRTVREVTATGQHRYDAADGAPLFLLLAARYLAWTGDREFVRAIWPRVERALAHCLTLDTDGDGLIEEGEAGPGWIDDGPPGGAHVSIYLAAVWRAALAATARVADVLGDERTADDCRARAARAGAAFEALFFDARRGRYAADLRADGTRGWQQGALQAVALATGAADPARARRWFDLAASDAMNLPAGLRMLPATDRAFDPAAAHAGAVRPAFTGWAALAEYRAGHAAAGLRHLRANAELAYRHQLGAFDDVLHGLSGAPAGACADSAGSAAMVVAPLIEGLLGVEPDAPAGRLAIGPCLPDGWNWMEARGLRCGDSVFDVRVTRRGRRTGMTLRRTLGPPLWLTLAPLLGAAPSRTAIDGHEIVPVLTPLAEGVRAAVGFQAGAENEVVYEE